MSVLNIVVPMAGAGSRFAKVGYREPKPLIPVHDVPMIRVVIENLKPARAHRFIFIVQKAHNAEFKLEAKLKSWEPSCEIVETEGLTQGAACTVLLAQKFIDNDQPLMIANSDQYIEANIDDYLQALDHGGLQGLIMTMPASDPKWSFAKLNEDGFVTEVAEKKVISNEATVGIYNFTKGSDFVKGARSMITAQKLVNGEFYVAPVYNEMIAGGAKIGIFNIGEHMHGIGTPDDLNHFLELPLSKKVTEHIHDRA